MNDPNKKVNPEETEAPKDGKTQVSDDEAEKVAGGASFQKWKRP